MDLHHRIAGYLHLAAGLIGLLSLCAVYLFFGAVWLVATPGPQDSFPFSMLGSFFAILFGGLALLMLGEVLVAVLWLRGVAGARAWMVTLSVFALPAFPVGSLLGAYSLWALLRSLPGRPTVLEAQPPSV